MDAAEFIERYDCIAICGCYRYGSTALSLKMTKWLQSHTPAAWLNEFFSCHHFVSEDHTGEIASGYLPDDHLPYGDDDHAISLLTERPIADHIMRLKLDWMQDTMRSRKLVIKIDPGDWKGTTGEMLERRIIGNPRVYKVGLNRQDVGNALISFLIGMHFGAWNFNEDELRAEHARSITPIRPRADFIHDMWQHMLMHNNWLWYMHGRLDHLVWYDEIADLRIPGIGMTSDAQVWSVKNSETHGHRLKRYFSNHDEIKHIADKMQHNLDELLKAVRSRYSVG